MKKFLYWLAIVVAYTFAILLLIAAGVAINRYSEHAADQKCPDEYFSFSLCILSFVWAWIGDHVDPISTAITALATIFIAAFTATLWRSTHELWKSGERAMKISNRAWVFAQPWPGETIFHENGEIVFQRMEITAYGNTPARVTELYVGFVAEARENEPTFPNQPIRENYNLAKGNRWEHRQRFATTTAEPVVYGYVRYTDAFDTPHESRYCYRLTDDVPIGFRTAGSAGWTRFD